MLTLCNQSRCLNAVIERSEAMNSVICPCRWLLPKVDRGDESVRAARPTLVRPQHPNELDRIVLSALRRLQRTPHKMLAFSELQRQPVQPRAELSSFRSS